MPAVGASEHGPESEETQVRQKANVSLEFSRARLSPLLGQKLRDQKGP